LISTPNRKKQRRASAQEASWYLDAARAMGWIQGYERLDDGRWLIEVPGTRREVYNDPDARGAIALTSREVYAFVEGCWAGSGTNPTTRAGHRYD
jgi:hypothetical protein